MLLLLPRPQQEAEPLPALRPKLQNLAKGEDQSPESGVTELMEATSGTLAAGKLFRALSLPYP